MRTIGFAFKAATAIALFSSALYVKADERLCLASEVDGIKYNLFLKPVANSKVTTPDGHAIKKIYTVSGLSYDENANMATSSIPVTGIAGKLQDNSWGIELIGQVMKPSLTEGPLATVTNTQIILNSSQVGLADIYARTNGPDFKPDVLGRYSVNVAPIKCKDF